MDQDASSGTCRALTLTTTADGSSSVALMMASRSAAQLVESMAPSTERTTSESSLRVSMAKALGDFAVAFTGPAPASAS